MRRNPGLLAEAEVVRTAARETVVEAINRRSELDGTHSRMRKLLWRQALWPRFMRRLIEAPARTPYRP
jgi:hypothetical protein